MCLLFYELSDLGFFVNVCHASPVLSDYRPEKGGLKVDEILIFLVFFYSFGLGSYCEHFGFRREGGRSL